MKLLLIFLTDPTFCLLRLMIEALDWAAPVLIKLYRPILIVWPRRQSDSTELNIRSVLPVELRCLLDCALTPQSCFITRWFGGIKRRGFVDGVFSCLADSRCHELLWPHFKDLNAPWDRNAFTQVLSTEVVGYSVRTERRGYVE